MLLQIHTHIHPGTIASLTYAGPDRHSLLQSRLSPSRPPSPPPDIILATYETLRSDHLSSGPLFSHATLRFARLVLDEAHRIRNPLSKSFQAVAALPAPKRCCLTGTPIQNSISDFTSLLFFICVPEFDKPGEFQRLIAKPIKARQPHGLDSLRRLVAATTLRRTKRHHAAALSLPSKTERVEHVAPSAPERQLYEFFRRRSPGGRGAAGRRRQDDREVVCGRGHAGADLVAKVNLQPRRGSDARECAQSLAG